MDFSSLNPTTSNALNIAARRNEVPAVERLLKKLNPSCIDNRGWTCLHEAAANDSYESLVLILKHKLCRPLAETHEGHTALYLACREEASIKTIEVLLSRVRDIANYGSTEYVTPLHIVSSQGRLELVQLLIDYGAMLNVQDFDGDTPLHDATITLQHEVVTMLLHAGAYPEIRNSGSFTPFHLACHRGSFEAVMALYPFITDINQQTEIGDTPLSVAVQGNSPVQVISFLLEKGADPQIPNSAGDRALDMALIAGYCPNFELILKVTDKETINKEIIQYACKPHLFKLDILEILLSYDLGPEFFDFHEIFHVSLERFGQFKPVYLTNAPMNSYLNICDYIYKRDVEKFNNIFYQFMMGGCSVNAIDDNECPPLVYIHYCSHRDCFPELFARLCEFDCNIDHCTAETCNKDNCIPDGFLASLSVDPCTSLFMFQYSLYCEPHKFLEFVLENGYMNRISPEVQHCMMQLIDKNVSKEMEAEKLPYHVLPLKHLCRVKIRSVIKNVGRRKTTKDFLMLLKKLPLPRPIQEYLRYT